MANNDDVLIIGSLKDKDLRDSINELVNFVGDKTNDMANKFTEGLDKMKLAMKDFAITQKVSVDLMKDAWRDMSSAFDTMVAAQSNATGSNRNGGNTQSYNPNTVGALEQELALMEKERKEIELGTQALRDKNLEIELQATRLSKQRLTQAKYKRYRQCMTRRCQRLNVNSVNFCVSRMNYVQHQFLMKQRWNALIRKSNALSRLSVTCVLTQRVTR